MPSRSNREVMKVVEQDPETVLEKRNPFDFPVETKSVKYRGVTYTFRELTVAENDLCRELATGPDDTFDGRVMIRQMLVVGAVEPPMTMEDLEKVPQRLYAQFIDVVNLLNDPATFEEDPGN
jgi:phage FluMu protein gp41